MQLEFTNPHLHGLLSKSLFGPDGSSLMIPEIDCNVITRRFAELSLKGFCKAGLITREVQEQVLSQEYTGFSVWVGDLIDDAASKHFVSRYIERGSLALERPSLPCPPQYTQLLSSLKYEVPSD